MAHVSLTELVDVARGVLPRSRKAIVDAHLGQCDTCAAAVRAWGAFADFARRDADFEPPADVVGNAASYFSANRADAAGVASAFRLPAVVATLVFDSLTAPALGVRSAGRSTPRHLLYDAAPFAIDLQVQEAASGLLLTGQIFDRTLPEPIVRPAHVLLMRETAELAQLECNEFGEFHGECERVDGLSLVIAGHDQTIVIPLPQ